MSYLPKSKYQKLQTSGDKFKDPITGKPYTGPYMQTSEGAVKGHSLLGASLLLTPIEKKLSEKQQKVVLFNSYNTLKPKIYSQLNTASTILSTKTKPTEKDYKKGSYWRYFARRNNIHPSYVEIDDKTFKSLSKQNPKYDANLHSVGKIEWALEGDVIKTNRNILFLKSKNFPQIFLLFPKLNEYQITSTYVAPTRVQGQTTQVVSQPTSTPSTGGGTSGGGGGGY
tara:strand:+ start:850 stop:1527 length:678 start_codon:yes stop_codon:yes gene_type:complete